MNGVCKKEHNKEKKKKGLGEVNVGKKLLSTVIGKTYHLTVPRICRGSFSIFHL